MSTDLLQLELCREMSVLERYSYSSCVRIKVALLEKRLIVEISVVVRCPYWKGVCLE